MGSYKELLAEHCDKVAFGLVGLITLGILIMTGTGEDVVGQKQKQIDLYRAKIERIANKQVMIPEPEIPDVSAGIKQRWGQTILRPDPGRPFLMYCQPAVVRLFTEKLRENLEHTKPSVKSLVMERDPELKKVVLKVTAALGKVANVKVTEVAVLRRALPGERTPGDREFKQIGTIDISGGVKSEAELNFVDTTVEAGRRYVYAIRTTAEPTDKAKQWGPGSAPIQTSDPFPGEGQCDEFVVPYDLRIRFSQAQLATAPDQAGVGYFDVEYYDYEKGRVIRDRLVKIAEWLKRGAPPESHILPHTRYFLMIIRKTEKGLVAVLKNVDKPADRIDLPKDKWYPPIIELPQPCSTAPVASEQPGETELTGGVVETPPAGTKAGAKKSTPKKTKKTAAKKTGEKAVTKKKSTTGPAKEPESTGPFK